MYLPGDERSRERWEGRITKGLEGTLGGGGYVHNFDCGDSFTDV